MAARSRSSSATSIAAERKTEPAPTKGVSTASGLRPARVRDVVAPALESVTRARARAMILLAGSSEVMSFLVEGESDNAQFGI